MLDSHLRRNLFVTLLTFACAAFSISCGDTAASDEQQQEEEQQEEEDLPESKEEAATLTNEGKGDFSLDICEHKGWYDDGSCEWFCLKRDPDCNADPLGPDPAGEPAQFPIVLAHGFMGSPTNFWAFQGVPEALRDDGHDVYVGEVPPFDSPEVRAGFLQTRVDQALDETGAAKVNIIAHSMGGLDSRYLISNLDYGDRVASLTTISTPHRGTKIADVALKILPGAFDDALNAFAIAIGQKFSEVSDDADMRATLEAIAEANADAFAEENPNDERVYYQSWAGISSVTGLRNNKAEDACDGKMLLHDGTYDRTDALLWAIVPFVAHGTKILPNDGMATVESAKWGEFQGCVPADHLDEVGQIEDTEPNHNTGFDHIRFYRNIAYDLSDRGF